VIEWLAESTAQSPITNLNRTGLVGGPIQREDGTHGTTQQVFPGVA